MKICWFINLTEMLSASPLQVPVIFFLVQKICPEEHKFQDINCVPSSREEMNLFGGQKGSVMCATLKRPWWRERLELESLESRDSSIFIFIPCDAGSVPGWL